MYLYITPRYFVLKSLDHKEMMIMNLSLAGKGNICRKGCIIQPEGQKKSIS